MTTIARRTTGGSTHTSMCTWRPPSTSEDPARVESFAPTPRATKSSGWLESFGTVELIAWKGSAATGRD